MKLGKLERCAKEVQQSPEGESAAIPRDELIAPEPVKQSPLDSPDRKEIGSTFQLRYLHEAHIA